jgi:hypothetical protein
VTNSVIPPDSSAEMGCMAILIPRNEKDVFLRKTMRPNEGLTVVQFFVLKHLGLGTNYYLLLRADDLYLEG